MDKVAPVRTIQVHSKYAAWLSDTTKDFLKLRNDAQKKAALTKDPDDWRAYKNLRNTATARLRTEKKGWEKEKLNAAKHDPTTIWKNVKSWLCWGNSGPPSRIFSGGEMLTSPARVAETMNRFFISKVQSLRDRMIH